MSSLCLAHIYNSKKEFRGGGKNCTRGGCQLREKSVPPLRAASLPTWRLKQRGKETHHGTHRRWKELGHKEEKTPGTSLGVGEEVCNSQRDKKFKILVIAIDKTPFKTPG